jgi:hypothetical protein
MLLRKLILSAGACGVLTLFAASLGAGEPSASGKKRLTAADCERLVRQLVNPAKPPFKGEYTFPEKLDLTAIEDKQEKIRKAYNSLSDNIEVSLPVLVKHTDDDRFSYVYEDIGTSGVITKASVGWACYQIIEAHVEVYSKHVTKTDSASIPRCPSFLLEECGGIDKWWEGRQKKTLAELQLEGVEWALRLEKPRLFKSNEEWAEAKKSLEKMAQRLRSRKKPIEVEAHIAFFGK